MLLNTEGDMSTACVLNWPHVSLVFPSTAYYGRQDAKSWINLLTTIQSGTHGYSLIV